MINIRPFTAQDLNRVDHLTPEGWSPVHIAFGFYHESDRCVPVLAEEDGRVIGVGNGSVHGSVGWLGHIIVDEKERRRGVGTALTRSVMTELTRRGCRSLALIASPSGAPVYARLGFRPVRGYVRYRSAEKMTASGGILSPLTGRDRSAVVDLDAKATGEDRSFLYDLAFRLPGGQSADRVDSDRPAEPPFGGGVGTRDPAGRLTGFCFTALREGPVVASVPEDGFELLRYRFAVLPDQTVAFPLDNRKAIDWLERMRFVRTFEARRMEYGDPVNWTPGMIFNRMSGASG